MKKVVVAMSGGIDSSVTALLLKNNGFDVTGITLKMFDNNGIKCCGGDESTRKFKEICEHIGIRYYVKNAVKIFKRNVIEIFVNEYLSGNTPNPCVYCNRSIKFDYLLKIAKALGADYIATGHYARIEKRDGELSLLRGTDNSKDQSYFLYPIKKEYLKHIIFPVGNMLKSDVKKIAKDNGLPLDISKESKDICFIPEGNYKIWLKKNGYATDKPGYIRDINGNIIGRHNGAYNFTLGQRKKLGVSSDERLYVKNIDIKTNTITVSRLDESLSKEMILKDINWLSDKKKKSGKFYAQIRYRHKPAEGTLEELDSEHLKFTFNDKQFAITPGQSCVFYDDDRVIGGGTVMQ
ncbi:MAG: tRNA 2-thiouridine(34) synthase MnmA [Elusimicrobiales bacterium]|jgi:tRNA-specific 2-thiouridylase|nr:tRNA 2-thiouridine(34) synthase MnmA [Elusimicrobiales bacterium]